MNAVPIPGQTLLRVVNVSKSYVTRNFATLLGIRGSQYTVALRSVSLDFKAGEITALLGPNGAGKTTLVNIICDLTRADQGNVVVEGLLVPEQGQEARRHIGYVTTNDRSFFWRLSGRKNLEFFAALQGNSLSEAKSKTAEMLDRFRLNPQADRPFHTYSAGMKKRLGLARAFLHSPALLLLDEPTNGLDARSTEELLDLVKQEIHGSRKTILWATHRAEEVERLCNRAIVLIEGRVCFDGRADDFVQISKRHMSFSIEVIPTVTGNLGFTESMGSMDLTVAPKDGNQVLEVNGVGDEKRLSTVLSAILQSGAHIRQVQRQPEPLHRVFSHLEDSTKQLAEISSSQAT